MKFILICVLTFAAASVGISAVRACGWPYWAYHVLVVSVGLVMYLISNFLTVRFIGKRAPDFASKEEAMPGVQKWELTAGLGVVPRWVSLIGILGLAFILASPFELLAWLIRTMQK
jgi:hypothetical protein